MRHVGNYVSARSVLPHAAGLAAGELYADSRSRQAGPLRASYDWGWATARLWALRPSAASKCCTHPLHCICEQTSATAKRIPSR